MTTLFDNLYRFLGHIHPQWRDNPVAKSLRVLVRVLANIVLPLEYRMTAPWHCLAPKEQTDAMVSPRLIVSLTSFPARTGKLWLVIESLLRQTHKPDKIILWLSRRQFASMEAVPQSLRRLQKRGLQIELRDGDLRSHKKYHYMLTEYPEDIFVTVDDDTFYSSRLLELLWEKHLENPKAIVCNHAHQITYSQEGELRPYAQWNFHSQALHNLFFIGVGGVLYPPHSLADDAARIDVAQETCPMGDDIWLNAMAGLQGTPVLHSRLCGFTELPVMIPDDMKLCSDNVLDGSGNDRQIQQLAKWFLLNHGQLPFKERNEQETRLRDNV